MSIIIASLLWILFLLFITWVFKHPSVKGRVGELFVAWRLKKCLDPQSYRILNDVMIPDGKGGTTQIDHVVLSPYGIFVVETKNMKGWIFGGTNDEKWIQKIYKKSNPFPNPFRQNYKHICCLAEITGLAAENFIHVIIFTGTCEIKTRNKLPKTLVCGSTELIKCITAFQKVIFDNDQLNVIQTSLQENRLGNTRSNRQSHIEYVQSIAGNKPDAPVICPQCGSLMVLRQAKNGAYAGNKFWGCRRYPACRCIINEVKQ